MANKHFKPELGIRTLMVERLHISQASATSWRRPLFSLPKIINHHEEFPRRLSNFAERSQAQAVDDMRK